MSRSGPAEEGGPADSPSAWNRGDSTKDASDGAPGSVRLLSRRFCSARVERFHTSAISTPLARAAGAGGAAGTAGEAGGAGGAAGVAATGAAAGCVGEGDGEPDALPWRIEYVGFASRAWLLPLSASCGGIGGSDGGGDITGRPSIRLSIPFSPRSLASLAMIWCEGLTAPFLKHVSVAAVFFQECVDAKEKIKINPKMINNTCRIRA
mmetsp:Transcript_42783/g.89470  ORF Transcript_42783/g.89470 Transcript_42783/m.89470 type:complete len:208 (+) Transcript_42783:471-1094(+)